MYPLNYVEDRVGQKFKYKTCFGSTFRKHMQSHTCCCTRSGSGDCHAKSCLFKVFRKQQRREAEAATVTAGAPPHFAPTCEAVCCSFRGGKAIEQPTTTSHSFIFHGSRPSRAWPQPRLWWWRSFHSDCYRQTSSSLAPLSAFHATAARKLNSLDILPIFFSYPSNRRGRDHHPPIDTLCRSHRIQWAVHTFPLLIVLLMIIWGHVYLPINVSYLLPKVRDNRIVRIFCAQFSCRWLPSRCYR